MPQPDDRPIVAITMGDAAGIGPEIIIKALSHGSIYDCCRPLVVGDISVMERARAMLGLSLEFRAVAEPAEACFVLPTLDVLDLHNVDWSQVQPGIVCAEAGRAAVEYVVRATKLALADEAQAIATAPLNKEAIQLSGCQFIDHTGILTEMTGSSRVTTMLVTGPLRTVHVTRHVPLRAVASLITVERVLETIEVTDKGLRALGIEQPHLAVAALNPHGGEGGLLGDEETAAIAPAVRAAHAQGIDAQGPFPADSIFTRALRGEFDAVVAMYHQ